MWFLIGFISGVAVLAAVALAAVYWVDQQLGNFH